MEVIQLTSDNRVDWLAHRHEVISSTEAAAVFDCSPYQTPLELHIAKSAPFDREATTRAVYEERQQPDLRDRRWWGSFLESKIAEAYAKSRGYHFVPKNVAGMVPWDWVNDDTVRPCDVFLKDVEHRMGSSFDFVICQPSKRTWTILEIKNVDRMAFARAWLDGEQVRPPAHIYMQVQHQLEMLNRFGSAHKDPMLFDAAVIAVMVGGNELVTVSVERDPEVGAKITKECEAFYSNVEQQIFPKPDYGRDYDVLMRQDLDRVTDAVILDPDDDLRSLVGEYADLHTKSREMDARMKAIKAQIVSMAGDASKIVTPAGTVSCGVVKANPGQLVTDDMVGSYLGARKAFRMFRFSAKS